MEAVEVRKPCSNCYLMVECEALKNKPLGIKSTVPRWVWAGVEPGQHGCKQYSVHSVSVRIEKGCISLWKMAIKHEKSYSKLKLLLTNGLSLFLHRKHAPRRNVRYGKAVTCSHVVSVVIRVMICGSHNYSWMAKVYCVIIVKESI